MKPGTRLRRWAGYLCSRRTMDQLIDPVIADLQHECQEASASGPMLRKHMASVRGYVAFWIVVTLHVPRTWLKEATYGLLAADRSMLVRAFVPAALTMTVVTAI